MSVLLELQPLAETPVSKDVSWLGSHRFHGSTLSTTRAGMFARAESDDVANQKYRLGTT